ncbi:hypothetical protein E4K72_02440 [Oxalobacteraceae bacterium OM1]|nr:hypothetical protein E4K72_02440 [Oxalobacteraceae bacterium OM1]
MSALAIRDLAPAALDTKAMSAVRGGTGLGSPSVNVYVPINIAQTNNLMQSTNVLNNSIVGAPGLNLDVNPTQWAANNIGLPPGLLAGLPGRPA